ncbi:MAG TPA: nucleoside deaminase [Methylovirgula sp.]|nr:nucleoside deaminase [Methylovirgula sp.]
MNELANQAQDLKLMRRCFELARHATHDGELPFGAVVARKGEIIAEAANRVSREGDITRHAELVAISEAQRVLGRKRLCDCVLYSVVEPCPMCSFASRETRIGRVVFALNSPLMGGCSKWDVLSNESLSGKLPEVFGAVPEIVSGFCLQEGEQIWNEWNPFIWHFMKRRGCFGVTADAALHRTKAPHQGISWKTFTTLLAWPVLSATRTMARRNQVQP